MRLRPGSIACALALSCGALAGCRAAPARGAGTAARSRLALAHALPVMDGAHLAVRVVEVTYPPGGASAPHRHPCAVTGYVIDGALRMRVEGEPEVVYHAGDAFYEAPNALHAVSANASRERPARFLATFTCDRDTALTVAAPGAAGGR